MKIAVPTRGNMVDDHFGHCESFSIYTVNEKKEITAEEKLMPPEGCGCKSNVVQQLADNGVKLLLAGNIGQGAINILSSNGINVFRGCHGEAKIMVETWLAGKLTDSNETCHSHDGCHHE